MDVNFTFGHERLDCYKLALEVANWAELVAIRPARKHLRDQLVRAADSVVANIAEGSGKEPGAARRHHYGVALGSAAEVCAILDMVRPPDMSTRRVQVRRVGAMLTKMSRL